MTVTLTQLRYLVAVADHRHFGRAAAACHVSQPTLSMQVRKLERELGARVFDRHRTPIEPTDLGRRIVDQARVVLREADRIAEVRDSAGGEIAGELRIGVIPTLGPYLLPRVLPELARRFPRLVLVIEELVTDQLLTRLGTSALDAALIATEPGSPALLDRPLFHEPFVALVGPDHRLASSSSVTPDALSLDDLWLLSEGHCLRAQTLDLCATRGSASARGVRFESGNLETVRRLVEHSGGMTLLPALAALDLPAGARALVRPFAGEAPGRDVRLVRPRAYLKRHLLRAFTQVLLETLPADVTRLR